MRESDGRNRTRGTRGRDRGEARMAAGRSSRRRSSPLLAAATSPFLLLVLLLGAATTTKTRASPARLSGDSVFDALDVDRDGRIDRVEFDAGLARVERAFVGGGDGDAAGVGGGGGGGIPLPDVPEIDFEIGGGGGGGDGGNKRRRKDEEVISRHEAAAAEAAAAVGGAVAGPPKPYKYLRRPSATATSSEDADKDGLKFWPAFTSSVAMILATEIGDKTFFIAAVLSMRNHRAAVFAGAILALIVMTILSTMMGLVLPNLLPRSYTHVIGGLLFLYFGIKLVVDSRSMEADKVSDELEEVEDELLHTRKKDEDDHDGAMGKDLGSNGEEAKGKGGGSASGGKTTKRSESSMSAASVDHGSIEKTFVQSLTLTFLAEWGDRSQIATIALAAAKDPYGVTIGGCVGHCLCTGMAVMGGRMLAARISEKTVSLGGGCIFLAFGLHSLFFEA